VNMEQFGFTAAEVVQRARELLAGAGVGASGRDGTGE
jgi:hypothetical protein